MTPTLATAPASTPTLPPAETPRFDMYALIHKALRRFMLQTLERLGAVDVDSEPELEAAIAQLEALLEQLRTHIAHENHFVHAAIEARRPAGARTTADDHVGHLAEISALGESARALLGAAPAQRAALALRLYRELSLFVAENLQHMHVEETDNNAALWALYSDAELIEIHDRLMSSIGPAELMDTLRWIVPAATPQELAAALGDMQAKAPPPAFAAVLDLVRRELDPGRWVQLAATLGVPVRR